MYFPFCGRRHGTYGQSEDQQDSDSVIDGCVSQLQTMLCLIEFARWQHQSAVVSDDDMQGSAIGWWPAECIIKASGKVCYLHCLATSLPSTVIIVVVTAAASSSLISPYSC